MADHCIACQGPGEYSLRALEVRTLHIRDLGGEKRVQALGDWTDACVCRKCAANQLALEIKPARLYRKSNLCFGIIGTLGLILCIVCLALHLPWVYTALGIAAIACGILALIENFRKGRERSELLKSLPEEKALIEAAWSVFLAHAPKKDKDADLTYIPVNEETLRRKNGDLMILYNLLPEIAMEAHKRLHSKKK